MSAALSIDTPPLRICDEDGSVHFSSLKVIGDSGKHYLASLRRRSESSSAQLIGTATHSMVLGSRPGESVVCYPGRRAGKDWESFKAEHDGATILNDAEWATAKGAADAVLRDPEARKYLDGARFEVPLRWQDGDVTCSTSGIDIVQPGRIGDLKTARTSHVERFQKQAFGFQYHCQISWYMRGCAANGIDTSRGAFVIAVETVDPFDVVCHDVDPDLLLMADKTLTLWLERFRQYRDCFPEPRSVDDWPGRAQASVLWGLPSWMQDEDEEEAAT